MSSLRVIDSNTWIAPSCVEHENISHRECTASRNGLENCAPASRKPEAAVGHGARLLTTVLYMVVYQSWRVPRLPFAGCHLPKVAESVSSIAPLTK